MQPASDEEVAAELTELGSSFHGYRAAEARARRLANWQDDALAAGADEGEGGDR